MSTLKISNESTSSTNSNNNVIVSTPSSPSQQSNSNNNSNNNNNNKNNNNNSNSGNNNVTVTPSIEQIEKVLQTLFTHHDNNLQNEANKWLLEFQNHPNIVPICLELIKSNQPFFSQFFGVQTLYSKIHSEWESKWSDEFRLNIKNLIYSRFLSEKDQINPVFTSKICSCLSAVMIHSLPRLWEHCIGDMLKLLNSSESSESIKKSSLDILCLLPLEFETVILSNSRRTAIKDDFYRHSEDVINTISNFLSLNISSQFNILLLKCVRHWIRFSNSKVLMKTNLLNNIFKIINNQETIVECLSLIGDLINFHTYISLISTNARPAQNNQTPDQANFQHLIAPTIKVLMELKPIYEESIRNDNLFICRAFADVLSQIVECYAPIMLDVNILEVQQCLTFLLELCSHPNKEISEITFDAWSLHSEYASLLDPLASGEPFQKLYAKLLQLLLERSSYPSNIDKVKPNSELVDDVSNYRNNVCDIIVSCFEMIGADQFIEYTQNLLKSQCKSWQSFEVVYYVFRCVCSNVIEDDDPNKAKWILTYSIQLPYHSTLSLTILYLLEDYGEFISESDLLTPSFNYILNLIQHEEVRLPTLKMLSSFADKFGDRLYKKVDSVFKSVEPISGILTVEEQKTYIDSILKLLDQMSSEKVPPYLQRLVNPISNSLKQLVLLPNDNYQEKSLLLINHLSILESTLNFPEDSNLLFKEFIISIWGILEEINHLAVLNFDVLLLEQLWLVFWKIVMELEKQFTFLDNIFQLLLSIINQFKTIGSSIYQVIDLLIDFFGKDQNYQNHFINLIGTLINRSLPILIENGSSSIPTITRIYKTLLKTLEKCPIAFNSSPNLIQVIDLSIEFLLNMENESIKSILDFLNQLFIVMNPHESLLQNYSARIITNTFKALVNDQSRELINQISLFLYRWISKYSSIDHQKILLECFIQSTWLPIDTSFLERERLSKLLLLTNQSKFKALLTDISSVCNNQMTWDVFLGYEM
ncbi:hypothetical protein RB653_001359 [Dictyostelium firmibasis]|uniref:Importin N-terminal domain-containing protein n=1 Tax=Dictyostelium firmibasis TaxID=79012 RepID=A0AAN7UGJ6_9MYCE